MSIAAYLANSPVATNAGSQPTSVSEQNPFPVKVIGAPGSGEAVWGPDTIGGAPTQPPVQIGGYDTAGNVIGAAFIGGRLAEDALVQGHDSIGGVATDYPVIGGGADSNGDVQRFEIGPDGGLIVEVVGSGGARTPFADYAVAVGAGSGPVNILTLPAPGVGLAYYITGFQGSGSTSTAILFSITDGTLTYCVVSASLTTGSTTPSFVNPIEIPENTGIIIVGNSSGTNDRHASIQGYIAAPS